MYSGPGTGTMLAAAVAWGELAARAAHSGDRLQFGDFGGGAEH